MNKKFKSVKATLIMGILLFSTFSVFVAITPTTSAGLLANLSSYVNANWMNVDPTLGVPLVEPKGQMQTFYVNVTYGINGGGLSQVLNSLLLLMHKGRQVNIKLEILADKSPWCTATLQTDTITANVPDQTGFAGQQYYTASLTLQVDLNAPAYAEGYIKLKVTVPPLGAIEGFSKEIVLNFQPKYLAQIEGQPAETNTKSIGPMDTCVFPITITNMGNDRTTVFLSAVGVPDGWQAVITKEIILEAGGSGTVYLTVKPPKGFGYHDEYATIQVEMIPARAGHEADRGEAKYQTFNIENRGFSFVGMEVILPIIILIIVVLFLLYYFLIKRKQKT